MTHGQGWRDLSHSHVLVVVVVGIASESCSRVQFNSGVHRTTAQLPTAPDSAPPAVAPGLRGNREVARRLCRTGMRVHGLRGVWLAGLWGRECRWPEPGKTSHGRQVTRNGAKNSVTLVGTSHCRAPAFFLHQCVACRAASQTHAQHVQATLSHSWSGEMRVTTRPLTCATARMSIAT